MLLLNGAAQIRNREGSDRVSRNKHNCALFVSGLSTNHHPVATAPGSVFVQHYLRSCQTEPVPTLSDAPLNQPARVSVVSTLRDRIHHGDAENTEGAQQNLAIGHYLAERNLAGQLAPNPLQIHCQIPALRDINPHIPRAVLQLKLTLPGF